MQVLSATPERAWVAGRGQRLEVDTRLVGSCRAGEWLLVFQGAARERLDPQRAAEIDATLDLLQAAIEGDAQAAGAAAAFALPSALSAAEVAALASGSPASQPASTAALPTFVPPLQPQGATS